MGRAFHDEADNEKDLDRINVDENGRFVEGAAARTPRGDKKRKATQLEKLGEALVKLKPGQLVRVPMPDDLRAAVTEAQRILAKGAHGGYRRQIQLIGKIMRTIDAVPVAAAYEELLKEGTMASVAFQQAERWRTRLLAEGDAAIEALVTAEAGGAAVDRTALRQLVRAAQAEARQHPPSPSSSAQPSSQPPQQQQPSPHRSVNQKKLFRLLRALFEPGGAAACF